jgi:HlyD family secretion protein
MKKRTILIIIIVALLVAGGIWYFKYKKEEKPVTLVTEKPEYGYISTSVTATGTIQPVDTVAVGSQVSGSIKQILVDFNSVVKKGQLLAQLDQSLFVAQVQQFQANLQQAQSNLTFQQQNFARQSELFKVGAISRADYETADNTYKSAKDNVNSFAAQLRSAQKNLSFTNIFSPIDGTVLSRNISEGQTVAASFSTPTLFSIAKDLTKMQVRASVDEADIGNVKQGERATFTVDAFPDDVFNGTVQEVRLQPLVSSNVVTYTTIINAPNDNLKLKPGMTANIMVYTKEINNALLISAMAINYNPDSSLSKTFIIKPAPDGGRKNRNKDSATMIKKNKRITSDSTSEDSTISYKKAFVWLKRGDTLLQKRIITGLDDDVHIQVIHGLTPADEVVTGVETAADQKAASSSGTGGQSPFMPRRPGQKPASTGAKKSS